MNGYMGKLLRVDLTSGRIGEEAIDKDTAKEFIGGAGYAARVLFAEVPASADPLGPENKLILMTGPLTGTIFPTACRYELCAKAPLTGTWGDASSAGDWAVFFKRAGFDGLVIEGRSEYPVYLSIDDGRAELKDARHLWGQDALSVQDAIRAEVGDDKTRVTCIGPAGEKQVLLAAVINDDGRAAGRGGLGAVMGAKNLKAVAARGRQRVPVADEPQLREFCKTTNPRIMSGNESLTKYGTAGSLDSGWVTGDVPVENWRRGLWEEGCIKLGGKRMSETILRRHKSCLGCTIRCSRWIRIESGKYAMEGPGPEYEALCGFGTMCLVDDMEAVCAANDLCNRYGIDVISTSSAVAFAMECYEKRIITQVDTGGIALTWGNADAVVEVTRLIGEQSGIGVLLGQGVKRAAAQLGQGSEAFAVHVKGLEVPMHDPRAFFGMAVSYATGTRGACHMRGLTKLYEVGMRAPEAGITQAQGRHELTGKGLLAKHAQDMAQVSGSLVICNFAAMLLSARRIADLLSMTTGEKYTEKEVLLAGERIFNLQTVFNLKAGISAIDHRLPPRLLEPLADGGAKGMVPNLSEQLAEYYGLRGWDREGRPTEARLEALGLSWVSPDW